MDSMSPIWSGYYSQLDPGRRWQLLQENLREGEDDGADAYRQRLFSLRYMEEGKDEPSVDRFLWAFVNLVQVYSSSRFLKRSGRKEVQQFLEKSGFPEAEPYGEAGREALYWEIRNAAKRYFKTCTGSEYRRTLFGLLGPGAADQKREMCKEVWMMTLGLEKRLGMSQELELWTKAVHDEYYLTDPRAQEKLQELSRSMERG